MVSGQSISPGEQPQRPIGDPLLDDDEEDLDPEEDEDEEDEDD